MEREAAECRLETALEEGFDVIIIEPLWLGDETVRWIKFGNFLHKTSVLSCLGVVACAPLLSPSLSLLLLHAPLGSLGIACAALYNLSWQFDPCCKYQVDYKGTELTAVPSNRLVSPSPLVLVRRNDIYRRILHNSLTLSVIAIVGWKVYKYYLQ